MNRFSYYITTHFIISNKDYNSCCNPHSVYQAYPKCFQHKEFELQLHTFGMMVTPQV